MADHRHLRGTAGRQGPDGLAGSGVARRGGWPARLGGQRRSRCSIGQGVAPLAAELASYGADRVHVFDDAELAAYATEPFARALAQVITQEKPAVVLIPYTAMGKDLAPRVAARVGAGLVSDCVTLDGRRTAAGGAPADVRGQGLRHRALGGRAADGHAAAQRVRAGRRRTPRASSRR